jgi:hypothetical protein
MKRMLLTLLALASVAMADDAKMKRQLVGTWDFGNGTITKFTSDGTEWYTDGSYQGWDVREGKFIEIRPEPESERNYTIISLTKHKCVIRENGHGDHFGIWTRSDAKWPTLPKNPPSVDDKTFFSGAHLGMTIDECNAYYLQGPHPVADLGSRFNMGALDGEQEIDFRAGKPPDPAGRRHISIDYRVSDGKIVYVNYWRADHGNKNSFSLEEIRYLTDLNSGQGPLVTDLYNGGEEAWFEVTTPEQEKLELERKVKMHW